MLSFKKNRIADIFFVLGMFILIYNPPLFMINIMHLVGGCSLVYLICSRSDTPRFAMDLLDCKLILGFVAIALYLFITNCVINGQGITSIVFPIYFIVDVIPFGCAMRRYAINNRLSEEWAVFIVLVTASIQSILACLAFLFPNIQGFFVDRMISYGYDEIYTTLSAFRMYGFSNALTNAMPIVQSLIAVLTVWLAINQSVKYYILTFFLLFSAIINARISIVIFGLGIVLLFFHNSISKKRKIYFLAILLLGCLCLMFILLPYMQRVSPLTYEWIIKGVNEIVGLLDSNTTYGKYTYFGYLFNEERIAIPEDFASLLFGRGYSIMPNNNPSGYQSDIGYICDIWVGGLCYIVLVYTFFVWIMSKLARSKYKLIAFMGAFYMIAVIFINIKGVAFSMNAFVNLLVILFCVINKSSISES